MSSSANPASHLARNLRLTGLALVVTSVAALGLVPPGTAAANTLGKAATGATRQKKRAIVRKRGSIVTKTAAAKKRAATRQKSTPPVRAAVGSANAVSEATAPTPAAPVAGGGGPTDSTPHGATTPATETISGPTSAETSPATSPAGAPSVTPSPESTPVTPPSQGIPAGRIFTGTKIKDFALNQSAPGAVTEVPSPTNAAESALQMTVSNSDVYPVTPTENPRAQLLSPDLFNPGNEFWWHSKFFLPADFPEVPGWMNVLEGPYGPPFAGSPPFSVQLHGNTMGWQRNSTYGWDIPWEAPIVRNKWVEVLVHCRFATEGFIELWINGEQITFFKNSPYNPRHEKATTRLNMATEDSTNNGGTNFAVIQSYRKAGILNSVSMLQGPMLIGSTRTSVE